MACVLKLISAGSEAEMARRGRRKAHELGIGPVEHELTIRLERAHELGERAVRSNGAAQLEIARAREIAEELTNCMRSPSRRP